MALGVRSLAGVEGPEESVGRLDLLLVLELSFFSAAMTDSTCSSIGRVTAFTPVVSLFRDRVT